MDSDKSPPDARKWKCYIRGVVMKKQNYMHVQTLLPEIKAMLAEGKSQR